MSSRVCIICLVSESKTRLFSMLAAQNEDLRRYEVLTGLKLKSVAYICQRCSIDLGIAFNLRQKAIESSKYLQASMPAKPQVKKTESTVQILSTQIVDPPLSNAELNNLFKSKPNVSVIATSQETNTKSIPNQSTASTVSQQVQSSSNASIASSSNTTRYQRRKSMCAIPNGITIQKCAANSTAKPSINVKKEILEAHSIAAGNRSVAVNNQPVRLNANNKNGQLSAKHIAPKPVVTAQISKNSMKRRLPDDSGDSLEFNHPIKKNTPEKPANIQTPKIPEPESELTYCFNSPEKGYYVESFKTKRDAEVYINGISEGTTFDLLA